MMGFFVFFLNPAFWYNTVIWGQVDTIHTFFALAALIYAERGHWKWALVLMLVAVNFKLQAIIFFPLVAVLCLPFIREKGRKYLGIHVLAVVAIQGLILLPFAISGNFFETIQALTTRSIDKYPCPLSLAPCLLPPKTATNKNGLIPPPYTPSPLSSSPYS